MKKLFRILTVAVLLVGIAAVPAGCSKKAEEERAKKEKQKEEEAEKKLDKKVNEKADKILGR